MRSWPGRDVARDAGLQRHPSLNDVVDPAVRIVEYDAGWVEQADAEPRRLATALGSVAVRDFLRAHSDDAAGCPALKREVAAQQPQDRLACIAGKDRYVASLEARTVDAE